MGGMGKCEDRLVKMSKAWCFKERKFRGDTWYDNRTPELPSPFAGIN